MDAICILCRLAHSLNTAPQMRSLFIMRIYQVHGGNSRRPLDVSTTTPTLPAARCSHGNTNHFRGWISFPPRNCRVCARLPALVLVCYRRVRQQSARIVCAKMCVYLYTNADEAARITFRCHITQHKARLRDLYTVNFPYTALYSIAESARKISEYWLTISFQLQCSAKFPCTSATATVDRKTNSTFQLSLQIPKNRSRNSITSEVAGGARRMFATGSCVDGS